MIQPLSKSSAAPTPKSVSQYFNERILGIRNVAFFILLREFKIEAAPPTPQLAITSITPESQGTVRVPEESV